MWDLSSSVGVSVVLEEELRGGKVPVPARVPQRCVSFLPQESPQFSEEPPRHAQHDVGGPAL
eukprot:902626-Rhodomonas_salina.1